MTHVTADLEYFKCDVCGVYLHKDIFCDHRRDCKGLNSQELKRSECRALQEDLSAETRRLIAQRDRHEIPTDAASNSSDVIAAAASASASLPPSAQVNEHLPVEKLEARQKARIRREMVEQYQSSVDEEFEKKYSEEKMKALMDFLNSED